MPLFNDDDLKPKPFKIYPTNKAGGGHEQVALWLAAHAQPPGTFFWSLAVNCSYEHNAEIEIEVARETLRRRAAGLPSDEIAVKKALIIRSSLFAVSDEIRNSLGVSLKEEEEET